MEFDTTKDSYRIGMFCGGEKDAEAGTVIIVIKYIPFCSNRSTSDDHDDHSPQLHHDWGDVIPFCEMCHCFLTLYSFNVI